MKHFIISILCLPIFLLADVYVPSLDEPQNATEKSSSVPKVKTEATKTKQVVVNPTKTQSKKSNETILYISTDKNFCENCLNMIAHPQKPLKLFLGRIVIAQNPLQVRFEAVKDKIDEDDISSKEYLLSHQYYDSLAQTDAFHTQELQKAIQRLHDMDLKEGETIVDVFKKLEPLFHFICKENGEIYWNEKWILDREALLWSGISIQSNQRGTSTPHLSTQLGSCQLVPQGHEIESEQCKEWRRSIKYYPPLQSCSILGNPIIEDHSKR